MLLWQPLLSSLMVAMVAYNVLCVQYLKYPSLHVTLYIPTSPALQSRDRVIIMVGGMWLRYQGIRVLGYLIGFSMVLSQGRCVGVCVGVWLGRQVFPEEARGEVPVIRSLAKIQYVCIRTHTCTLMYLHNTVRMDGHARTKPHSIGPLYYSRGINSWQ